MQKPCLSSGGRGRWIKVVQIVCLAILESRIGASVPGGFGADSADCDANSAACMARENRSIVERMGWGSIGRTLHNILSRQGILQRQAAAPPALKSAQERAHSRNPFALQKKRRPGAAGFIGSGAVENDIAVPGDLTVPQLEFGWQHPDRTR